MITRFLSIAVVSSSLLLSSCGSRNETPTEVVVYYITCGADYDRWIESDSLKELMNARKTVVKLSKIKRLNDAVRTALIKENWKKREFPRIDVRVLLVVRLSSGRTLEISLDPKGNFMFEGNVYYPNEELNDILCELVDGVDCFCKDAMPWLENSD